MSNMIFVCGIYGVGKTTFSIDYASKHNLKYLSASALIKEHKNSFTPSSEKVVVDVDENQSVLITALKKELNYSCDYLLDGHMVVPDVNKSFVFVGFNFFKWLKPQEIILVTAELETVFKRLLNRDGKISFSRSELLKLQHQEKKYAKKVSDLLQVPLQEVRYD